MDAERIFHEAVDITDPAQRLFNYATRTNPQSKGELSIDMVYGPGVEVWQNPEAEPGEYRIQYQKGGSCPGLSGTSGESVTVRGWVIDRSAGRRLLPAMKITNEHTKIDVAVVRVSSDGIATVTPVQQP